MKSLEYDETNYFPATGLLAYPEVRQFFLVHLSVVKTFLDE